LIAIVRLALKRPYTFIVMAILIALFGGLAVVRTPVDIFPNIKIPVVAAAWSYSGLSPDDMAGRVIYYYERQLSLAVNDIDHIESQSLTGIGIVKIFFHPDAAGHPPAADPELRRLHRADPAAGPVQSQPGGERHFRPGPEFHSPGAGI